MKTSVEPSVAITWAVLLVAALTSACGHGPGPAEAPSAATPDDLLIVDCLLPGQIRQLGTRVTYMTARRAVKTTALDCSVRGGEYVARDLSNEESALRVWKPLADQGDPEAQNYVGEIYERGLGSEPNLPAAAAWYARAAEQDYAPAQINLGELYERGLGVPKDVDKARDWYRRASGLGMTDVEFVSSIATDGRVVELEERLAQTALQLAQLGVRLAGAEAAASDAQRAAAQIPDLQRELARTGTEAAELERQLEAVRTDALSRSDLEQARVVELQAELAERQDATAELRDRIRALETRQAEERRQSGAEIDELAADREVSESQIRELERELAGRSTDVAALESRLEEARREALTETSSARVQLSGLEAELVMRQRESAELQTQIGELEADELAQRRDASAKITELEEGMEAKAAQIQRLQSQLEQERARAAELLQASADPVELPGPSIQIIEPVPAPATPGVEPTRAASSADERIIVGRVEAPGGLVALLVDGAEHEVNPRGIFKVTLEASVETRSVRVAAIDSQGKRAERVVRLAGTGEAPPVRQLRPLPEIDFGDYYALVIGNSDYRHLPDLKTPRNDAAVVSNLLKERFGFEVQTIYDASRYDVLSALNELRANRTEADNILIYYAGHGELDEANMRGHWLPVDAEPNSTANWISNVAVTDILNAMSARHVLVVSDSCYSGTLTRSALAQLESGLSEVARAAWQRAMVKKRSRTALTSGSLAPVLDEGGEDHSVFARAFVDALIAIDGVMEGQRLYQEIAARVTYAAERYRFDQVPQYAPIKFSGHESGDFFLVPGS